MEGRWQNCDVAIILRYPVYPTILIADLDVFIIHIKWDLSFLQNLVQHVITPSFQLGNVRESDRNCPMTQFPESRDRVLQNSRHMVFCDKANNPVLDLVPVFLVQLDFLARFKNAPMPDTYIINYFYNCLHCHWMAVR